MDENREDNQNNSSELSEITSELVRNVLYGKWLTWGGNAPPESVQNTIMSTVSEYTESTIPNQVRFGVSTLPGSKPTVGVFASDWIKEGTEMGPYPGSIRSLSQMKEINDLTWELFTSNGDVRHVIEVNSQNPSWMIHVQCARHEQEQNLETFQVGDAIYYRTTTRIHPGQELLVWYGSDINQYMGVPEMSYPGFNSKERQQIEGNTRHSNIPSSNGKLKCVVCCRGFNSRSNLRSHMRIHTMERPFVCEYCSRSFSQSSTLRNHLRLHTGEKPYKCHMCRSAYSQLAGLRAHEKSSRHKPSSTSQGSSHADG